MTSATALLDVEGGDVTRGERTILARVSLSLSAGDIVLLKGPNGSGKTSLLRALAGLAAIEGAVRPSAADRRSRIVYCGHADGVKLALTVAETLAHWRRLYGATEASVDDAADRLALVGLEDRRAGALSAGQKRRLGLARLMIAGKPLWLLDEPTASLDAASSARVVALIEAHAKAGGAALIATHDRLAFAGARSLVIDPAAA